MHDLTGDFQPLAAFRKRPSVFAKLMKKTQRLLDLAARQNPSEGIRQGLEDLKKGRSRPAREVFVDFEAKRGISS
jgi:hypothetical protein